MRVRPGANALIIGMAVLGAGLLSAIWAPAVVLLPLLVAIAFSLAIIDAIEIRAVHSTLQVVRQASLRAGRGIPINVEISINNNSVRNAKLEVRDVLPASALPQHHREYVNVAAGNAHKITYSLVFPERGDYTIGPIWVRFIGSMRVLEFQREYDSTCSVAVLPESAVATGDLEKKALAESMMLMRQSKTRLHGDGLEFESLSEYRPGDDPRRVDWRSSARHQHLVVRRYQVEQHRDLMILIDSGRLMGADTGRGSKLDRAVDAALMLARVATQKGDRCGVGIFDNKVQGYLPPVTGQQAMRVITEALYNVRSEWQEPNFRAMFAALQTRLQKRSLVIILSDLVDEETTEQYRTAIHSLSRRHLIIFVALRTPLLDQIKKAEIADTHDVARKAVTMRLLRQRERALDTLNRGSIHVLDVEPRDITVPLVNKYISLRERNLL